MWLLSCVAMYVGLGAWGLHALSWVCVLPHSQTNTVWDGLEPSQRENIHNIGTRNKFLPCLFLDVCGFMTVLLVSELTHAVGSDAHLHATCMFVFERRVNWQGIQWKPCLNILCVVLYYLGSSFTSGWLSAWLLQRGILHLPCLSHHKAMWYLHGLACLPWQPERKGGEGSAAAWDSSSTGVKHTSLPTHTHTDTWKPNAPARVGYGGWLCQYWLFCEDDTGTCWLFIFWLHCQVSGLFLR